MTAAALLPLGMAFLMFTLGLGLEIGRVVGAFRRPRALAIGLVLQVVALPAIGALLVALGGVTGPMALGLMLAAAAPGGITSNYIAHLARADVALSVAMTLVTSLAVPLTLPLVLHLWGAPLPESAGLAPLAVKLAAVTLVPMLAGVAARRLVPDLIAALRPRFETAAKVVFAAIVLATFAQNAGALQAAFLTIGPLVVLLNLGALTLGHVVPLVVGLAPDARRAITVEISLQNIAVAIFVAQSLFGDAGLALPGLIYAVVMNLTALALIASRRRQVA